jgi:hypothetical protein
VGDRSSSFVGDARAGPLVLATGPQPDVFGHSSSLISLLHRALSPEQRARRADRNAYGRAAVVLTFRVLSGGMDATARVHGDPRRAVGRVAK